MKYYDGSKLLSLLDLNKEKPEIYMVTSNRSAGKTTYFLKLLLKRFLNKGELFLILFRYKYELKGSSDKVLKTVLEMFYRDYEYMEKVKGGGSYIEYYIRHIGEKEWILCGYAVSVNGADGVKKYSQLLSSVSTMFFDEFQSENQDYCNNEIQKFISIHNSIARGSGSMSRYLPVYMCSNPVDDYNPYYQALGVSARLTKECKFLKGSGWVLERNLSEDAKRCLNESKFNKAFQANNKEYLQYVSSGEEMLRDAGFINRLTMENSKYVFTLQYEYGKCLGVWLCDDCYYVSDKHEPTCKLVFSDTSNYILGAYHITQLPIDLKHLYYTGQLVFENRYIKEIVFKMFKVL